MAKARTKHDREIEEFRNLMEVPGTFHDGFNWTSLIAAVFIALLMVPGALYMGLLAGQGIGGAAQWVTVILFIEVARRAHKHLNRPEVFVLFFMSGAAMAVPFSGLLWNQFYARSDVAQEMGIAELLPTWFAPAADSESYNLRTFFHVDWLPVLGLVVFGTFFSQLSNLVLGYGLFRLASDIEKLPFPMAPIGAQGVMALAIDPDQAKSGDREKSWRWRVFSIGGALGLTFGSIYLLLPTVTGALLGTPIMILPIPFSDYTTTTQSYLPAVATGMSWDLGNLLMGMVLPFFAMLGSFAGLVFTFILNPILHELDILTSWRAGDDTIATMFKNNVDFYFSFTIGVSLAIAIAGLVQVWRSVKKRALAKRDAAAVTRTSDDPTAGVPAGRGDLPAWIVVACYLFTTITYILVSGFLIEWHLGVMIVLFILGFVYTPVISYVTARLEGMVGEVVEIPMIREASLILSGFNGVKVWFLPMPVANYGQMTVFYRQCELTGTRFTSIWKASIVLYPIILISSIFFANFIWGLAEVPSVVYPYADRMWELQAQNQSIMYSATLGDYSIFDEAFSWSYLATGTAFGVLLFGVLTQIGLPIFFIYGVVRGLGQSMPHAIIPQFIGALIGRYYFQKKLGLKWRQYIPVVMAGFSCGAGLITTVGVGVTFLSKAVIPIPY
jgi:hypothetical protein